MAALKRERRSHAPSRTGSGSCARTGGSRGSNGPLAATSLLAMTLRRRPFRRATLRVGSTAVVFFSAMRFLRVVSRLVGVQPTRRFRCVRSLARCADLVRRRTRRTVSRAGRALQSVRGAPVLREGDVRRPGARNAVVCRGAVGVLRCASVLRRGSARNGGRQGQRSVRTHVFDLIGQGTAVARLLNEVFEVRGA